MNVFVESLPELIGALGSAGAVGIVVWCARRWRRSRDRPDPAVLEQRARSELVTDYQTVRRYTLLGTTGRDGGPIQVISTRPVGTFLIWPVGRQQERFELTDVRLYDGTFAAEPVDRYETVR
ncbi:hypothetical protein ACFYT4_17090 [Streptomyces sp. NPDC004609]|uniref:hypothetical protein n=1 Tax=Streptomyces sp. NPDC004609 TaxID=3364704 RepID=UPI0036BE8945